MSHDGSRRRSSPVSPGIGRLQAHADECRRCSSEPLPLDRVAVLLDGYEPGRLDPAALSQRVLVHARPILALRAVHLRRRRLAASVLLSLLPLPVIAFFNAYMLYEAWALLRTWLPGTVVACLVIGYAAMLVLLCALTYAALPLFLARSQGQTAG